MATKFDYDWLQQAYYALHRAEQYAEHMRSNDVNLIQQSIREVRARLVKAGFDPDLPNGLPRRFAKDRIEDHG